MSTSTDIYLWQSYNSVFAVQFLTFFFVLLCCYLDSGHILKTKH